MTITTPHPPRYASFGESTFVGREDDVLEVTSLVQNGARLITVFGVVGVGKTRLVHEIAGRVNADGGRAVLVSLAEVTGPDDVLSTLAAALPLNAVARRDLPTALRELARDSISSGPLLLVLDEFERIVSHAPIVIDNLLAAGDDLQVLVTSRELLRHGREQAYEVLPLTVARSAAGASPSSAMQLMSERVRRYRRSFPDDPSEASAAEQLLQYLDGIPLAIELVSPRVAMLGAASVLDALRGGHSERATDSARRGIDVAIEGSFALLTADELRALIECAVFRGAFTIDAIEDVIDLPESAPTGLDLVHAFREKSLVARTEAGPDGTPRFRLYAPVRELTSSRLSRQPEQEAVIARHASHYLGLAEAWVERVDGLEGAAALLALGTERENLESVVDRALSSPATPVTAERAFRGLLALAPLAFAKGPLATFARRLDLALTRFERIEVGRRLLASMLVVRGRCRRRDGRSAEAESDHAAGLAIADELDDRMLAASIHAELLLTRFARGRSEEAFAAWAQACELASAAGDGRTEGIVLTRAAVALRERGLLDAARPAAERALDLHRRSGNAAFEALTLGELALGALERRDTGTAYELVERALLVARASGNMMHLAFVSGQRATVRLCEGDLEGASEDMGLALGILRDGGYTRFAGGALGYLGIAAFERGDLDVAEGLLAESRALINDTADVGYGAMFGGYLALVRASRGNTRAAGELLAAVASAMPPKDALAPVLEVVQEHVQLVLSGKPSARALELAATNRDSSDVRIAVRQLRRAIVAVAASASPDIGVARPTLRIASDGSTLVTSPGGKAVDCGHRRALAPLLALLAQARVEQPGQPVTVSEVVRCGWPEQRAVTDAAKNRLRVALTHLRKLGLGDVLVWSRGGYALDPSTEVIIDPAPTV